MKNKCIFLVALVLIITNLKVILNSYSIISNWYFGIIYSAFVIYYFINISILVYKIIRITIILPSREEYIEFNRGYLKSYIILILLLFFYIESVFTNDITLLILSAIIMILVHDRLYQFIYKKEDILYYYDDKIDKIHKVTGYEVIGNKIQLRFDGNSTINIDINKRNTSKMNKLESWENINFSQLKR